MIPEWLRNGEEDAFAARVCLGGCVTMALHLADDTMFRVLESVVEVEFTVLGVVRVESESEETFLEGVGDERAITQV